MPIGSRQARSTPNHTAIFAGEDGERNEMKPNMKVRNITIALMLTLSAVFTLTVGAEEVLPKPEQQFAGKIARTTKESKPDFPKGVEAPKGAPNVLLILTDDVGFGASSVFGGPIQTPNFQRIADSGLR